MGALLKLILLAVIVVALGVFFLGWNLTDREDTAVVQETGEDMGGAVGTTGRTAAERGRDVGAEVGARAGEAAEATQRAIADGSVTAKIKAKMGLDERVKALNLDIDTTNGVVTVRGVVGSEAERERALQLARETEGVRQVIDQLTIR